MKTSLTGSLIVCVAAAGIAVGALTLEPGGDPAPATQPTPASSTPAASPYGDAGATATGSPPAATLEISDFTFSASAAEPGATVAVSNRDGFPHTATADDGSFQSGTVDAGGTGGFVAPSAPGTYPFHCEIHPQMNGALTVG